MVEVEYNYCRMTRKHAENEEKYRKEDTEYEKMT